MRFLLPCSVNLSIYWQIQIHDKQKFEKKNLLQFKDCFYHCVTLFTQLCHIVVTWHILQGIYISTKKITRRKDYYLACKKYLLQNRFMYSCYLRVKWFAATLNAQDSIVSITFELWPTFMTHLLCSILRNTIKSIHSRTEVAINFEQTHT